MILERMYLKLRCWKQHLAERRLSDIRLYHFCLYHIHLWKLLHQLLPTEERLARILPNSEPTCKLCSAPANADLKHSFFGCDSTREVGGKLLSTLAQFDSDVTPDKLLRLEFECEPDLEMPLVWVTAQTLAYMWSIRCSGKIVDPTLTRASLESKLEKIL